MVDSSKLKQVEWRFVHSLALQYLWIEEFSFHLWIWLQRASNTLVCFDKFSLETGLNASFVAFIMMITPRTIWTSKIQSTTSFARSDGSLNILWRCQKLFITLRSTLFAMKLWLHIEAIDYPIGNTFPLNQHDMDSKSRQWLAILATSFTISSLF